MINYYVVCTCSHPAWIHDGDWCAACIGDCPMHGEPKETVTETSGEGEMWIDMEGK